MSFTLRSSASASLVSTARVELLSGVSALSQSRGWGSPSFTVKQSLHDGTTIAGARSASTLCAQAYSRDPPLCPCVPGPSSMNIRSSSSSSSSVSSPTYLAAHLLARPIGAPGTLHRYAHLRPTEHGAAFSSCASSRNKAQASSLGSTSASSTLSPDPQSRTHKSSSSEQDGEEGADADPEPEPKSFKDRMRYLWKRYGWWALGVYQLWSFVDVSLTFAAIHLLGADHIRKLEGRVREWAGMGKRQMKDEDVAAWPLEMPSAMEQGKTQGRLGENNSDAAKMALQVQKHKAAAEEGTQQVSAAASSPATPKREREGEGMISAAVWTELVLAYTIHKTLLLPFRVALTAAVTPAFVKQMVKLGWAKPNTAVQVANKTRSKAAAQAAPPVQK